MDKLVQKNFGFSFKPWYDQQYWSNSHIPYALFEQDICVATVMVSLFNFTYRGQEKYYVQLGTIMCDEAYRNNDHTRQLLTYVLQEWEPKCDGIFLYANNEDLSFYPKFGFIREKVYRQTCTVVKTQSNVINLDLSNTIDHASIKMQLHQPIVMFHILMYLRDYIYYLPNNDSIAIIHYKTLFCYDIYAKSSISIKDLLSNITDEPYEHIVFCFPVWEKYQLTYSHHDEEDTHLFVFAGKDNIFHKYHMMFPTICHT